MLDVTSRLADEKRNDVRIEAALAKLYGSEMGWRVVDELMQVCGGRGYETARSLEARGLRGVPVEQALRDMRVNRIFEGSSEIMHLIVAREAMDQHLHVAGDLMDPEVAAAGKAKALGKAGAFYANWYPRLTLGRGHAPGAYGEYGELAEHMRFVERTSRKLARSTFYGMARWQAGTEGHGAFLGRIVDIGAELFAMAAAVVYAQTAIKEHPERADETRELAEAFCTQAKHRTDALFHDALEQRRPAQPQAGAGRPQGPAHVARGGHHRPLRRRWPDGPVGRVRPRDSGRRRRGDEWLQHVAPTRTRWDAGPTAPLPPRRGFPVNPSRR